MDNVLKVDKRALNALSLKEKVFVLEYLTSGNKKQAAIAAGYSAKTADVMGCKLMKRPLVAHAVQKCERQIEEYAELNLKAGLDKVMAGVNRHGLEFVDKETGLVPTDLRKLGPNVLKTMDGIKQTVKSFIDGEGNEHRTITTEIKCVSQATANDQLFKLTGAYAPEKHETNVVNFNFDGLYVKPPTPEDPVEKRMRELTLEAQAKEVKPDDSSHK